MRRAFLALVLLVAACDQAPTGVDSESASEDATVMAKKGGRRGDGDREPIICVESANDWRCPIRPIGPVIGL